LIEKAGHKDLSKKEATNKNIQRERVITNQHQLFKKKQAEPEQWWHTEEETWDGPITGRGKKKFN